MYEGRQGCRYKKSSPLGLEEIPLAPRAALAPRISALAGKLGLSLIDEGHAGHYTCSRSREGRSGEFAFSLSSLGLSFQSSCFNCLSRQKSRADNHNVAKAPIFACSSQHVDSWAAGDVFSFHRCTTRNAVWKMPLFATNCVLV